MPKIQRMNFSLLRGSDRIIPSVRLEKKKSEKPPSRRIDWLGDFFWFLRAGAGLVGSENCKKNRGGGGTPY